MNESSTQSAHSIRDVRAQVEGLFADWIQIVDDDNRWTIEDFLIKKAFQTRWKIIAGNVSQLITVGSLTKMTKNLMNVTTTSIRQSKYLPLLGAFIIYIAIVRRWL